MFCRRHDVQAPAHAEPRPPSPPPNYHMQMLLTLPDDAAGGLLLQRAVHGLVGPLHDGHVAAQAQAQHAGRPHQGTHVHLFVSTAHNIEDGRVSRAGHGTAGQNKFCRSVRGARSKSETTDVTTGYLSSQSSGKNYHLHRWHRV